MKGIKMEGSVISAWIGGVFSLLCALASAIFLRMSSRYSLFNVAVTQNRMHYIEQVRNLAIEFCVEVENIKRAQEKDCKEEHLAKLYKLVCSFRFYFPNVTEYADWDGKIVESVETIYRELSKENIGNLNDVLDAFSKRMQSLLAVEWKGMVKEAWKGKKLSRQENQRMLKKQLTKEEQRK